MSAERSPKREIFFGPWRVRPELWEIEGPGGTVRVKPKAMEVFLALLQRPRQVLSREELLAEVWQGAIVVEEILTQAIAELRRAFGDDFKSPQVIETVRGHGYRLLVVPRAQATNRSLRGRAAVYRSPLVGRRRECEVLAEALERAERGSGGVILFAGEPGIGKTRLAEEAFGMAQENQFLTLSGRCSEESDAPPLLPFVEIVERALRVVPRETFRTVLGDSASVVARMVPELHRAFPDLPPSPKLPPEQQRRYLFNAFLELLERGCELGPVCLVLDDLQWANDATALLLRHLAEEAGRLKLLLIGTFRDTEVQGAPAFRAVLAELIRQRTAKCLTLRPLTPRQIRLLLEGLGGAAAPEAAVDFFVRATDGNPFYIEELYGHLLDRPVARDAPGSRWDGLTLAESDVPEGVRVVILERAGRLAKPTRDFVSASAVVGRTFDPRLARYLVGEEDRDSFFSAVDEAERAGMVAPRKTGRRLRYEFTHDLIRHSLLSDLSEMRRRRMHLQVVEAMEAIYPDVGAYAADVVSHLERAGRTAEPSRTIRYSILAAESALDTAASEDALRHLDRALSLVSPQDRRTHARILFLRGYALRGLLRWEEALRDWQAAVPIHEELGDAESMSRTCTDIAIMALWRVRWGEVISIAERGLALLGDGASVERAHLLCQSGAAHCGARQFEAGERILAEAEAIARHGQDPELLGAVLFYRSVAAEFQLRVRDQLTLADESAALLRSTANVWDFVPALAFAYVALYCLGRWREMAEREPELEVMAERVGHVGSTLVLQHLKALRELWESPDLDAFGAGAKVRLEVSDRMGFPWAQIQSRLELVQLASWRGEAERAEAFLREARDLDVEGFDSGTVAAAQLLLLARRGDLQALDVLAAEEDLLPELERPAGVGAWTLLLAAVEGLALLGTTDRAASLHPLVLHAMRFTQALVPVYSGTSFLRVAGISAAAGQQWEEASSHFDAAWEACERMPNRPELAQVLHWRAWMLSRRSRAGDEERARELLAESRVRLCELGIDPRAMGIGAALAAS